MGRLPTLASLIGELWSYVPIRYANSDRPSCVTYVPLKVFELHVADDELVA